MPNLIEQLRDARRRTLSLVEDLTDDQLAVSKLEIVNPFRWELGHVAFFYDMCVRNYLHGDASLIEGATRIYDSFKVDHDDRWDLPLPSREETLRYMERVAASVEHRLKRDVDDRMAYVCQLSILHEDMHCEAFLCMRQTLGYGAPVSWQRGADASGSWPGDVEVPGGRFSLGADPETVDFVFDNEKWAHPVEVASFRIAKAPVTNAEFAEFVDDGGYDKKELWSDQGWVWRQKNAIRAPAYWERSDGGWSRCMFEARVPIAPHQPVMHVGWHEALAYCRWAGRRLPTEAEWEMAASLDPATGGKRRYPWGEEWSEECANLDRTVLEPADVAAHSAGDSAVGCRQMLGNAWEWTASAFYPFPGYIVDVPYREYSAPWFGYRKVLKGGAFATRARLAHNVYRNFFTPDRRDIFAGFRTCAE